MTEMITIEAPGGRRLTPDQFTFMQALGEVLQISRAIEWIGGSPERGAYMAAKAYELGFPATSAPEVFHNINGKLSLAAQAAWALVLQSGLLASIEADETDDACKITLTRKDNGVKLSARFSLADAAQAELVKKGGNWEKYPRNMLYWRALGFAIDRVFPDVTMGLKLDTTLGDDVLAPSWRPGAERLETPAGPAIIVSSPDKSGVIVIDPDSGEVLS